MKICSLGVWNETIPGISFDPEGISNYARIQQRLMKEYPRGEKGREAWEIILKDVKRKGRGRRYDCIVGVSGGVDSSFLLYTLKEKYGLRPLAVTLDNGWSSEIAVKNIKRMTDALQIDLETYVIDYEEIKDLMRSFIKAGLPWIDGPTDTAIKSVMYKTALATGVKYIFRGNDFRTEGKQPREWTYSDDRQLRYVHRKFGSRKKLSTFPYLSFTRIVYCGFLRRIKDIRPYYYLDYSKASAREFLEKRYGWQYYGGHHHENIFTKFVMAYWLPVKFGIDKRIINLSAQVVSGYLPREKALEELSVPALNNDERAEIRRYVLKKLDFSEEEFDRILKSENRSFRDYPNHERLMFFALDFLSPMIRLVYPQKPMTFVAMEVDKEKKDRPGAIIIEGHVQGLSNTRSLGEMRIPVYVIDKGNCIARYSRFCSKFFYCPDYISPEFKDFLIRLAEKEKLSGWTLIPSNDHAVLSLARNRDELKKYYRFLTPEPERIDTIFDKLNLMEFAGRNGIPVPGTYSINSFLALKEEKLRFPVILKGRNSLTFYRNTGIKALLSENYKELKEHIGRITGNDTINNAFIQEYIPFDGTNRTISFTAFSVDGQIKTCWAGEKLREHPLRFGTATFAKSVKMDDLFQQSSVLLNALRFTGVCEIEYLRDPVDMRYKLIEINARTWLWVELAKRCGVDYAKYIYNYLNDIPVDFPGDYKKEMKWINCLTDFVYGMAAVFSGKLSLADYIKSLKGEKVWAVYRHDDIKPSLMFLVLSFYIFRKRM